MNAGWDAARAARLRLPTPMFKAPRGLFRGRYVPQQAGSVFAREGNQLPAASSTATVIGGKSLLRACARASTTMVRAAARLIAVPHGFDIEPPNKGDRFCLSLKVRLLPNSATDRFRLDAVMPRLSEQTRAQRRQHILTSAWTCFSRDGFHATSMDQVIAQTGMSSSAVYRYFGSKEEIIRRQRRRRGGTGAGASSSGYSIATPSPLRPKR